MPQKLLLSVPDEAREVFFHLEITPAQGRVLLYRTALDPWPQELTGSVGTGRGTRGMPDALLYVIARIGDVSVLCGWLAFHANVTGEKLK